MQNQILEVDTLPVLNVSAPAHAAQNVDADTEQNALEQEASEQETVTTPVQIQAVAALLAATQRKIRRRKRRFWGSLAVCEVPILFVMFPVIFIWHNSPLSLPMIYTCLAIGLVALAAMLRTLWQPVSFNAEEITRVGGAKAVPLLLDSLLSGMTPGRQKEVCLALTHLLPNLKATDANLLDAGHRRILNRFLNMEAYPGWCGPRPTPLPFPLAILKAYEQVGGANAIPVVEKLANLKPRNERSRAVQQAAMQCLPLLQSHTVPLDQTQTLLRAASQSEAAGDILLRPAADTDPAPAEQLLRAASREITL